MKVYRAYLSIFKIGLSYLCIISYAGRAFAIPASKHNITQQTKITKKYKVTQSSPNDEELNPSYLSQENKETISSTPNNKSSIIMHEFNQYVKYAKTTHDTPLSLLDTLMIKHWVMDPPYIPFLQNFDIRINFSNLIVNVLKLFDFDKKLFNHIYNFSAGIDLLFKKNMQLSGDLGFCYNSSTHQTDHPKQYISNGLFGGIGGIGVVYLVKYSMYNLYGGVYINRSIFTKQSGLAIHWGKLVLGSEKKIKHSNWYIGFVLGVNFLMDATAADRFFSNENYYHIPEYGNSNKYITFNPKLYIKYTHSFIKKILTSQSIG